jgi:hypothetical protein
MKRFQTAFYAIVFTGMITSTFQCASPKEAVARTNRINFEQPGSLKLKPVYFQEWYAGIDVGGTGLNVFVPIVNKDPNIEIGSIYFRNLKGKLVNKDGKYVALLENESKLYTFKKTEKPADYPFTLKDNECAISYIQYGRTKYFKVSSLNEVAGVYYENGPPSIYEGNSRSILATTDQEDSE